VDRQRRGRAGVPRVRHRRQRRPGRVLAGPRRTPGRAAAGRPPRRWRCRDLPLPARGGARPRRSSPTRGPSTPTSRTASTRSAGT